MSKPLQLVHKYMVVTLCMAFVMNSTLNMNTCSSQSGKNSHHKSMVYHHPAYLSILKPSHKEGSPNRRTLETLEKVGSMVRLWGFRDGLPEIALRNPVEFGRAAGAVKVHTVRPVSPSKASAQKSESSIKPIVRINRKIRVVLLVKGALDHICLHHRR